MDDSVFMIVVGVVGIIMAVGGLVIESKSEKHKDDL